MLQGYELALQPTNSHEDYLEGDDYSENSTDILSLVQARLKRKKSKSSVYSRISPLEGNQEFRG